MKATIFYLEDEESAVEALKMAARRYARDVEDSVVFDVLSGVTIDELLDVFVSGRCHALVVDRRLGNKPDGAKVVERLYALGFKVPVAFYSASHILDSEATPELLRIRSFVKGENSIELLEYLADRVRIGLSELGTAGSLQKSIDAAYYEVAEGLFDSWYQFFHECVTHRTTANASVSEAARTAARLDVLECMQRYVAASVFTGLVRPVSDERHPLEWFVRVAESVPLSTGDILSFPAETESVCVGRFIVLTPACDLVLRGTPPAPKVQTVIMAPILSLDQYLRLEGLSKMPSTVPTRLCRIHASQHTGGEDWYCDFARIAHVGFTADLVARRGGGLRMSESFLRDLVGKLSSYLGRQGSPDVLVRRSGRQ
jgi:hypothetical protein